MIESKLWWRTSLPWYRRIYLMWKYRGYRMSSAMNVMHDEAVARAKENRGI